MEVKEVRVELEEVMVGPVRVRSDKEGGEARGCVASAKEEDKGEDRWEWPLLLL